MTYAIRHPNLVSQLILMVSARFSHESFLPFRSDLGNRETLVISRASDVRHLIEASCEESTRRVS